MGVSQSLRDASANSGRFEKMKKKLLEEIQQESENQESDDHFARRISENLFQIPDLLPQLLISAEIPCY